MKLPFLQHTGVGVHFTAQCIRWVELTRIRHKISISQSTWQSVENRDTKTALCKLVNQIRPSFPYVTANLDPADLRQMVVEVPYHDSEEELTEWLADAPKELISRQESFEDFTISNYLFGDPEEAQNCLFVMVNKDKVNARIELLKSAGLHPIILTTGDLETGYGMMFNLDFVTGDTVLIKSFENHGCLLEYQKGLLAELHMFQETGDANELIEEAQSLMASRSGYRGGESGIKTYLATEQVLNHSLSERNSAVKIRELNPLSHLTISKETLPTGQAVACGMAVKQLYPGLDTLNLLEDATVTSNLEIIDKKDALTTTASTGGILLLIYLVLALSGWILENNKQQLDERVDAMEDKITAVENARQQVHGLRSAILQVRNLVEERSSTVRYLEVAGRALPEGVWLDELKLAADSPASSSIDITIRGYALSERFISALLENLERRKEIRDIRLVYSEHVDTQDIYNESSYREKSLIHYEIQMRAND